LIEDSESGEKLDESASELMKALFDHICVIFPSTFELAAANSANDAGYLDISRADNDEFVPFVSLNPRLLDVLAGDDLLQALDSLSEKACRCPFLSNESLECFQSRRDIKMHLYAVMLAKFIAAASSWHDYDSTTNNTTGDSLTARVHRLKSLSAYCQTSAFIPPTLTELSQFFLGACPEKAFAESPLETLAMTPMSWLVQHANASNGTTYVSLDFHALDKGILKLLTKTVADKTTEEAAQPVDPQPVSAKKKKKAKKKKSQKVCVDCTTHLVGSEQVVYTVLKILARCRYFYRIVHYPTPTPSRRRWLRMSTTLIHKQLKKTFIG
jgi:hypothetical protein